MQIWSHYLLMKHQVMYSGRLTGNDVELTASNES